MGLYVVKHVVFFLFIYNSYIHNVGQLLCKILKKSDLQVHNFVHIKKGRIECFYIFYSSFINFTLLIFVFPYSFINALIISLAFISFIIFALFLIDVIRGFPKRSNLLKYRVFLLFKENCSMPLFIGLK